MVIPISATTPERLELGFVYIEALLGDVLTIVALVEVWAATFILDPIKQSVVTNNKILFFIHLFLKNFYD
jgi:hypothetical protein